jgi:hypothetical protein
MSRLAAWTRAAWVPWARADDASDGNGSDPSEPSNRAGAALSDVEGAAALSTWPSFAHVSARRVQATPRLSAIHAPDAAQEMFVWRIGPDLELDELFDHAQVVAVVVGVGLAEW